MEIIELFRNLQFFRFLTVGALATLLHSSAFFVIYNFDVAGAQGANILGYSCAVTFSLIAHGHWSFRHQIDKIGLTTSIKFLAVSLSGLTLNAGWVWITESLLRVSANFSLIGIVIITPVITYLFLKNWVYRSQTLTKNSLSNKTS